MILQLIIVYYLINALLFRLFTRYMLLDDLVMTLLWGIVGLGCLGGGGECGFWGGGFMGVIGCFTFFGVFLCWWNYYYRVLLFHNFYGDLYLYEYQYTNQSVIQLAFFTNLFSKIHSPSLNAIFGSETRTYFQPIGSA